MLCGIKLHQLWKLTLMVRTQHSCCTTNRCGVVAGLGISEILISGQCMLELVDFRPQTSTHRTLIDGIH